MNASNDNFLFFFRPKKEPKKGLIRRASNSFSFAEAAELSAMLPSAVPTSRDRLLLRPAVMNSMVWNCDIVTGERVILLVNLNPYGFWFQKIINLMTLS